MTGTVQVFVQVTDPPAPPEGYSLLYFEVGSPITGKKTYRTLDDALARFVQVGTLHGWMMAYCTTTGSNGPVEYRSIWRNQEYRWSEWKP